MLWIAKEKLSGEEKKFLGVLDALDRYNRNLELGMDGPEPDLTDEQILQARQWYEQKTRKRVDRLSEQVLGETLHSYADLGEDQQEKLAAGYAESYSQAGSQVSESAVRRLFLTYQVCLWYNETADNWKLRAEDAQLISRKLMEQNHP